MNNNFIKIIVAILFLPLSGMAQDGYQMKGNDKEITIDFLSGYYQQDGNNGAVTGGIGTEELTDFANMIIVNVPIDSTKSISVTAGADYYTSASTDNIDNNVSSASSRDVRAFGNVVYSKKNLKKGLTYGLGGGFSAEYDYISWSGRVSLAKEWNEGNSELSINGQAFIDRWDLIYPSEIRGEVRNSVASPNRQSFNFQATYSQVISKRIQMSISGEAIYMTGLLSTPFHRVYFADQSTPDIERLPDARLKIPLGIRVNIFPFDGLIMRSYYRYYQDDFGINAHTASLELPIKMTSTFTVSPSYRYHTQSASDYFAPFAIHTANESFYTSDFDLSALESSNFGIGFGYSPLYGISRSKIPLTKKLFIMDKLQFRAAYYTRSTGLTGFSGSLALSFKIK